MNSPNDAQTQPAADAPADQTVKTTTEVPVNPAPAPTTPDGVVIEPGQVWRDNDKRTNGRRVRIIAVGGTVHVARILADGSLGRSSYLSASRMRAKSSTGFKLVEHPDGRIA